MFIPTIILAIALAFCVCLLLLRAMDPVARRIGLVDIPDSRKHHTVPTPLIGGLCISSTMVALSILWWLTGALPLYPWLTFAVLTVLLTILGAYDDKFTLTSRLRLSTESLIALAMVYFGDILITSVGNVYGTGATHFSGPVAMLFTVFCVIGVVNAVNMIDGVDGLSGSIVLLTLLALFGISIVGGRMQEATLLAFFIGACAAFLTLNVRAGRSRARLFMGDAGCLVLGFAMAWFFISLSQGENAPLSPVLAGWILGLPLMDTISVVVRRVVNGTSPFAANRDHFHHQLLQAGHSVNKTVLIMASVHGLFIVVALIGNYNRQFEPFLFWAFVVLTVLHHYLTPFIIQRTTVAREIRHQNQA